MAYSPEQQKKFYAIRAALQPAEKVLIDFYEVQWLMQHRVPTVDEVFEYLRKDRSNIKLTTVHYYLNRKPVQKALKDRGIPFEQHTQEDLTSTQIAAATVVTNVYDSRSMADKLDALGVSTTQYRAWLNDPQFKNYVDSLADQGLANIRPAALTEFSKKIAQGDWPAIKYYLDITGAAQSTDSPKSEVLLRMLVEIIQKHVKDPETIAAIAQDIKLASANRTLEVVTQKPMIESHVVDQDELLHAKQQLGLA